MPSWGAAAADGTITEAEQDDLERITRLLSLSASQLEDALAAAARPTSNAMAAIHDLAGLSVCFTGTLTATLGGTPLTRAVAQNLVTEAGLHVVKNVTKGLDLLFVADPDTLSGKARKAREFGTRIMAEQVFWRSLGIDVV